jgi:hypothetical protein
MSDSVFNPELLKYARELAAKAAGSKTGFVDPAMAGGGGGAPPGGDPMAAGGAAPMAGPMPPMPPMGGDPAAAGGDPMAAGGGDPMADLQPMIQQAVQQAMAAQGGGAGGGGGEKMKVDVNTEVYHIKKLLTRIAGELGITIDPQMLLGDPAMDPEVPPEQAAQDPQSVAAGQGSSISGIAPIQGASPALAAAGGAAGGGEAAPKAASWEHEQGRECDRGIVKQTNQASALLAQLRALGS